MVSTGLDRRTLLKLSAVTAGGVALAACSGPSGSNTNPGDKDGASANPALKGSKTKPLPKPKQFKEAPDLAALVKSGKLDAVEERLPKNPYVVPHNWIKP